MSILKESNMNRKIVILVVVFLLFVPFRLPIGVLFIELVTAIANSTGKLSHGILVSNVVVTKIIYDLAFSAISLFNLNKLILEIRPTYIAQTGWDKGNDVASEGIQFETGWGILLLIAYTIFDAVTTYSLYYELI